MPATWTSPGSSGTIRSSIASPLPANLISLGSCFSGRPLDHLPPLASLAPFLSLWVDGLNAPLPAHHFSTMAPEPILNSSDNLNPQVTSGPFMMAESVPGDHYTLVRNPRYYLASEGLPYLDKIVFRIVHEDTVLKDLQAGTIDSAEPLWM